MGSWHSAQHLFVIFGQDMCFCFTQGHVFLLRQYIQDAGDLVLDDFNSLKVGFAVDCLTFLF
jgi:hypothetical protein